MIRGIYISASGMVAESTRTDTIANNLANCNTTGYKKDVAVGKDFAEMLIWRINDGENQPNIGRMGLGTVIDEIGTVHDQGSLRMTGNPLNLAIEGSGYFAIQTQNGVRYTRDGSFSLNSQGQLVTMDGNIVAGQNGGPIEINMQDASPNRLTVDSTGRIFVIGNGGDTMEVGAVEIVSFADDKQLVKQGSNLYNADNAGGPQPFTGRVVQGYLEQSNANVVSDMITLIATYRAYEVNAKAVQAHDELTGKAVNDVGRV